MPGRSGRDEMQGVRNYGAPLGTPTPSPATDRPRVGPADPSTIHRAIAADQTSSASQARAGLYQKPIGSQASTPAPRPVMAGGPAMQNTDLANGVRNVTNPGMRPAVVNQAVEDAQK